MREMLAERKIERFVWFDEEERKGKLGCLLPRSAKKKFFSSA